MTEGISYLAGAELPVVIVNIMRGGPGLGGILPSQSDYFQAVKGGGHGGYRCLVLAPSTVQEAAEMVQEAFDLADKYRNPVMILGDGIMGQMMEPVEFKRTVQPEDLPVKPWATTGARGRTPNIVNSLHLAPEALEAHDWKLQAKYERMAREDCRHEAYRLEGDLDVLFVAYGTVARIVKTAIEALKGKGVRAGLFRPLTLFPYPGEALAQAALRAKHILVSELNCGQMLEDVRYHVGKGRPVAFFGRTGGMITTPEELVDEAAKLAGARA
jgi:2-oxoglutarate ferredoxin oxidoreductase subunit alpha